MLKRACYWRVNVVPHAGTWIEITLGSCVAIVMIVVPHAGTWIEIGINGNVDMDVLSFPTRERGLKFF